MQHKKEIGERRENAQAVKLDRDQQNAELIDFLQTLEDAKMTAELQTRCGTLKKRTKRTLKWQVKRYRINIRK